MPPVVHARASWAQYCACWAAHDRCRWSRRPRGHWWQPSAARSLACSVMAGKKVPALCRSSGRADVALQGGCSARSPPATRVAVIRTTCVWCVVVALLAPSPDATSSFRNSVSCPPHGAETAQAALRISHRIKAIQGMRNGLALALRRLDGQCGMLNVEERLGRGIGQQAQQGLQMRRQTARRAHGHEQARQGDPALPTVPTLTLTPALLSLCPHPRWRVSSCQMTDDARALCRERGCSSRGLVQA